MKEIKKGAAFITIASLLVGVIGPASYGVANVYAAEVPEPVAEFDFENLTDNSQMVDGNVKATGTYSLADSYVSGGKALSLNGKNQSLKVTKKDDTSLLTGMKELTISYDAKHNVSASNWIAYAAPNEDAQTYMSEHYIGILHKNSELIAERYNSNNIERPLSAATTIDAVWTHVDVVYSEEDVAIYVDGVEKARQSSGVALDEMLGEDSIFQIGKANWVNGEYYNGLLDNFRIYDRALTGEQVTAEYNDYVLECDVDALSLPEKTDRSLTLPKNGKSGLTTISWESSDKEVMSDDGKVTRGEEDKNVTMTATVEVGGRKATKGFEITVLKKNPDDDVITYTKELTLNTGFISEDLKLPSKVGDAEVTWETSDAQVITKEGKVIRGDGNKQVTLTASIQVEGAKNDGTKEFPLTVLAKGNDAAVYVSSEPAIGQNGGMKIALEGENGYEALHKDQPIMYSAIGTKSYAVPQIFRKADTSFGLIAADGGNNGNVIVYDSKDLTTYENERMISLPGISAIQDLYCVYDSAEEVYKLFVESNGNSYLTTTKDFVNFTEAELSSYSFEELSDVAEDAVDPQRVALTKKECEALKKQFQNPYNTEVTGMPKDITIKKGETFEDKLDSEVTAAYSDGTERTYSVRWNKGDIAKVNTERAGEYTVRGTIGGSAYYTDAEEPLIEERADPYIVYNEDDGYYYFTASYPMNGSNDKDGYDRLVLRRAKTISELSDAEEVTIWDEKESDTLGRFIWAPELHKIGDSWYFISTAGQHGGSGTSFDIRPFMIKCNDASDMMNPDSWGDPVNVKPMAGDEKNCLAVMSLDMTYFEAGGNHYLSWADKTQQNESRIYIAKIDADNPTQLISKCAVISQPEYVWERVNIPVNEGSAVIKQNGKVYLAFSASATGMEYCVGLLTGDENADLTNPDNWEKTPYPVLSSADFDNKVSGPGHNSFTVDEYGNPVIVYHARPTETHTTAGGVHNGDPLYDPCRHCYVKPVFFGADGAPILNLSDDEFAKESEITVKVTVEGKEESNAPVLEYKFDEEYTAGTAKDSAGDNSAVLNEGASYVWDEAYGQVLYLDGNTAEGGHNGYLAFPEGFFDGRDRLTISMDVKEVTRSGNYFTFTVGQDNQKYLFLKTMPTSMKLAVTTSSYQNEKIAQRSAVYPNNSREWINVKIVITPQSISLYQNGKLIAEHNNTKIAMSDLGDDLKAYLGKSFYSNDKYFRGYFDNVKVYDWAMSDAEVKNMTKEEERTREEVMSTVKLVADTFEIPNADNIKGNITLPKEKNGVSIQWTSSDEQIISTKTVKNQDYDDTPAGVVTRPEQDTKVTLTAVFSKNGNEDVTKKYEVTVKAAKEQTTEEDYVGYLFVRFTGSESDINHEQTYFSLSRDGLNWENLNEDKPVLTSTFGESGLRDHYIARSPEGDKFYMIATDLSIYQNNSWMEAGANGSHSIVVWESDDLVNWSEPWLAEIAPEGAGCTWAPEFIYDEKTGEYVVYWAATTLKTDEEENITQEYENHAIYYCKTRDFRTFTEAKLYHDGGVGADGKIVKVIDSTMIEQDGTYYRYTKNESKGTIEIDKSDAVLGEFTSIASDDLSTNLPNAQGAVEGPIIFKMNEKTSDGKDQWCLMVDRFARGQGYYPLVTTDLESGEFELLSDSEFSFPSKYRHGYVMPVTAGEYSALQRKWGSKDYVDTYLLEETIKKAEAISGEHYTEESYAALQQALTVAKEALETVASTEEADAAAQVLQAAIDALEEVIEVVLESIQITTPDKVEYEIGEELDLTGFKVLAIYSDGTEVDVTSEAEVGGFDNTLTGTQTITVTYEEQTAEFEVLVKEDAEEPDDGKGEPDDGKGKPDDGNIGTGGSDAGKGNVSTGADNKNKVQTGDSVNTGILVGLFVLAGVVVVLFAKRKKYE